MIDSQMDDMIKEKLALKEQVDSLEQNLSKQIKEKECLLQTFTAFKHESKEKEAKNIENEIDLEKKIKELANIIFKVGQSAHTVCMLTKPQAPKELPMVSLVNESLKKLKLHLANFNKVVKIRTTPNARTKGEWGDLLNETMEVQTVFDQTVQQSSVDKQCLENAKKDLLLENDRLLHQIMSQDVLLTVMNSMSLIDEPVNVERKQNESCNKCFNLEAELLKSQNAHNTLLKRIKGKEIVDIATQKLSANTIVPGMFKLDLGPLAPRLLQNRETHSEYLMNTQEQADILRAIVKQAKAKQPLDNLLDFTCKHAQRIQELLVYVRDTCPNAINLSAKKVAVTPKNNVKKVRLSKLFSVRFGNDHIARIIGYGDYQLGNVTILRVYYVEGLRHNLFSVGQFCDVNLEVAFRKNTCFIRNLEGVDLISRSREMNLYIISLHDMLETSPICLLSKASKTKSWLWHHRLSHLNFVSSALGKSKKSSHQPKAEDTNQKKLYLLHMVLCGPMRVASINRKRLSKSSSACAIGKSTRKTHIPKSEDTNQEKLYLLHMDLCGPMRVESVNGKKYILIIVDDYSRFTWVKFLRSKDETLDFIIKFLKMIQVRLKVQVFRIRTDNGTEFVNHTLREYYEEVGISHEISVARSPQQNGVVERHSRTLIEAARTMLIYVQALLFLWAEAVVTACFTQNRFIIRLRHGKTPYELLHSKPPDLSFFHVFGALCYPTNDSKNFSKLQPKADMGLFISYAPTKKAFRIFNQRTRRIMETIHIDLDELTAMASEHRSSGPALNEMTPGTISSGLVPTSSPSTSYVSPSRNDWDLLFQLMFDELLNPPTSVVNQTPEAIAPIAEVIPLVPIAAAPRAVDLAYFPVSTSIDQDASSASIPSTQEQEHSLNISQGFKELPKTPTFCDDPLHESLHEDSTSQGSSSNMIQTHTSFESLGRWTKDHPIANVIDDHSLLSSSRENGPRIIL
nr:hypothetical protein [Tanacetum cinerariifolium]